MKLQTSIEQVAGILHRADLHFDTHSDGDSYRLRFGRDAVFIHFDEWQKYVRVALTSPVLQQLDREDAGYVVAMNRVNELNRRHRFVKWTLDGEVLLVAHDLLGDTLDADELVNAVYSVAGAAANAADELEDATGGWRYDEMVDELELSEVEEDDS
jgi:hypothetical protein